MNTETGQIEYLTPEEASKRSDLLDVSNLSEEQREELQRIWTSHNETKEKSVNYRKMRAVLKQIVRANRSKYQPHVGAKQQAKLNK